MQAVHLDATQLAIGLIAWQSRHASLGHRLAVAFRIVVVRKVSVDRRRAAKQQYGWAAVTAAGALLRALNGGDPAR
jgi:hypothetical protein